MTNEGGKPICFERRRRSGKLAGDGIPRLWWIAFRALARAQDARGLSPLAGLAFVWTGFRGLRCAPPPANFLPRLRR